ncbi:hypothetical protein [Faecalibacterium sp. I3-3-89]|uniref:hypothetical protein n=1 Tax=Faecalibacterium sp. I3-3-89 TaxID=2929493 RepID=UPI002014A3F2|nr:hypothetical protein [Faecalibacterium sp. I3-3-89]UQK43124.1 hypothetical protein MTP38_00180 [Faecalibacterium sp. I3-3-89]
MRGIAPQNFYIIRPGPGCARTNFFTLKIPQLWEKVKSQKMNNKKRLHGGAGAKDRKIIFPQWWSAR